MLFPRKRHLKNKCPMLYVAKRVAKLTEATNKHTQGNNTRGESINKPNDRLFALP